jgi:Na+/melibiose symporter-like transporter
MLSAAGYAASRVGSAEQPQSAIDAIYLTMGLVPAAISLAGIVALLFYNLSEARLKSTELLPGAAAPAVGA